MNENRFWMWGGVAGIVAGFCYGLFVALPWPETQLGKTGFVCLVSAFPILNIITISAMYTFVAEERNSVANRLAFVFGVGAFTTVLAMTMVQSVVSLGVGDAWPGLDDQLIAALKRVLNLVDLGLDVAWDMLLGTAILFLGFALRGRTGYGLGWAICAFVCSAGVIGLNIATFPCTPDSVGLFDIGPFVGLFAMALSARLIWLGRREPALKQQ